MKERVFKIPLPKPRANPYDLKNSGSSFGMKQESDNKQENVCPNNISPNAFKKRSSMLNMTEAITDKKQDLNSFSKKD